MKTLLTVLMTSVVINAISQSDSTTIKDSLVSKKFEQIPFDSLSKKATLTEVLSIPTVKQQEIYKRVYSWYTSKQATLTQPSEFSKKNDPDGKAELATLVLQYGASPQYSTTGNFDKLVFHIAIYNLKDIRGALAPKEMSGYEMATLTVLIKDGRYKLQLNNFIHQVAYVRPQGFSREGINWEYEMKKVDFSEANWKSLRQEGLNKLYQILIDLSDSVRKNVNDDMDF